MKDKKKLLFWITTVVDVPVTPNRQCTHRATGTRLPRSKRITGNPEIIPTPRPLTGVEARQPASSRRFCYAQSSLDAAEP
jgi:hypothetical protein